MWLDTGQNINSQKEIYLCFLIIFFTHCKEMEVCTAAACKWKSFNWNG